MFSSVTEHWDINHRNTQKQTHTLKMLRGFCFSRGQNRRGNFLPGSFLTNERTVGAHGICLQLWTLQTVALWTQTPQTKNETTASISPLNQNKANRTTALKAPSASPNLVLGELHVLCDEGASTSRPAQKASSTSGRGAGSGLVSQYIWRFSAPI